MHRKGFGQGFVQSWDIAETSAELTAVRRPANMPDGVWSSQITMLQTVIRDNAVFPLGT